MAKKRVPKEITAVVRGYVRRLMQETDWEIKKVIIYGSQAKGNSCKWSDIDVCIISPSFGIPLKNLAFLLSKRNDAEVMRGLEPIGFNEQDFRGGGTLINEIHKTGVVVSI